MYPSTTSSHLRLESPHSSVFCILALSTQPRSSRRTSQVLVLRRAPLCQCSFSGSGHVSQLRRKSVFFRGLFSLLHPSESRSQQTALGAGGVPRPGLPEDVANLSKVIYDGPYVPSSVFCFCFFPPGFMLPSMPLSPIRPFCSSLASCPRRTRRSAFAPRLAFLRFL